MKKLSIFALTSFLLLAVVLPNTYALKASWDRNHEPDVIGYKVYLCSSYDKAVQLEPDVVEVQFVTLPCICCGDQVICQVDWDSYWQNNTRVFIVVTAIDTRGIESEPTIAYVIWGNVVGTYNDGVHYEQAELNEADMIAFATNFGRNGISHQQINCAEEFTVITLTEEQRCDFDKDGDVDKNDLNVLLPPPTSLKFE